MVALGGGLFLISEVPLYYTLNPHLNPSALINKNRTRNLKPETRKLHSVRPSVALQIVPI